MGELQAAEKTPTAFLGVRVSPRILRELRVIAKQEERSVSGVVRLAIEDALRRRMEQAQA